MRYLVFFVMVFFLLFLPVANAHQPYLIDGKTDITIDQPEISRAFYGQLAGEPAVYRINSSSSFELYVNVLVPDVSGIKKDISAAVIKNGETNKPVAILDGANSTWTSFYEPFGDDKYLKGPEFKDQVGPGNYEIRVWSSNNDSKYVLAVGEKEAFPPAQILRTILLLPSLKMNFFGRSLSDVILGRAGLYFAIPILLFVILVVLVYFLIRSIARRRARG